MQQIIWYFNAGGILMWPLLLCSLVAVAVILERWWRLMRFRWIENETVQDIEQRLKSGDVQGAIDRHRNCSSVVGRILSQALDEHRQQKGRLEKILLETAIRSLQGMAANMGVLVLISKVAPLLGLLGTVLGMIEGFEALERAGVGKEQLAGAIRIALITTAAGLMVAIPAVVALAYFRSKARKLQEEFEDIFSHIARLVDSSKAASAREEEPVKPGPVEEEMKLPAILSGGTPS